MVILALDTSSAAGSAAIVRGGAIAIERAGDPSRTHGERLPRELMSLLEDARLTLGDLDAFAVCTGPGSFTGLRVGIATIQGLALARGKLVTPVSAFEALLYQLPASAEAPAGTPASGAPLPALVAVWLDAQRREVFAALYDEAGREVAPATSLTPDATLDAWSAHLGTGRAIHFAGNGALKYAGVLKERLGDRAMLPECVPPLAGRIGSLAAGEPGRAVRPHAVVPLYVRRSDAELARDRRKTGKGA